LKWSCGTVPGEVVAYAALADANHVIFRRSGTACAGKGVSIGSNRRKPVCWRWTAARLLSNAFPLLDLLKMGLLKWAAEFGPVRLSG